MQVCEYYQSLRRNEWKKGKRGSDGDEIENVKVEEKKKNSTIEHEGKRESWFDARCEIVSV